MPHCQPPVKNRFSSTNPPNYNKNKPRGKYLTPLLKKFLEKRINYEDPETQKMITGKVKDAIIWRLLLNACQGENEAIKEIFNRVDGKTAEVLIDQSKHYSYKEVKIVIDRNADISSARETGNRLPKQEPI